MPDQNDPHPTPQVADFGIAKRLTANSALTLSGAVIGTPTYMAPEQAKGTSRDVGAATDVYSLGAILYEMLSGRPPFLPEDSETALTVRVITEDAVSPAFYRPGIPRDVETICLKCLEKEPRDRYEVDAGLARGERVVVFQHHYPFQVWEDFAGPGLQAWRDVVQTRPITALFAGHTHYGQIANDGRHVYVATRSIGDPEGGPAGYAIVHLDGEDFALTYRSMEDKGPVVLITHPRRTILATKPAHIVPGPEEVRVRAWSNGIIGSAEVRIDDGEWMRLRDRGDLTWSLPIPGDTLAKGEHTLEARIIDMDNAEGTDRITFSCDLSGRYNPFPTVEPVVRETKFC